MRPLRLTFLAIAFAFVTVGCNQSAHDHPTSKGLPATPVAATPAADMSKEEAVIRENRAKLSAEDQALVEAQEWCAVENEERLGGEMGVPIKVMIKGQPVFLCCGGCRKAALANPEKTLAKVAELKEAKKAITTSPK
jgi:hypothetical protein